MVELSFLMHFHSYKLMFFFFSFSPVHVFCHHRKSLHWTAFTGWYTFMHFTCRGSTRGVGLVQCIAFGNCTERTTSFTRCKSSIVQHYWRIEAHRLAESSCWKRTGNLFYGITRKKRPNKRHHLNTERIARNSWGKTSNRQRDREWKNVAVNRISSIFVWIDRVVGSHFRLALALF